MHTSGKSEWCVNQAFYCPNTVRGCSEVNSCYWIFLLIYSLCLAARRRSRSPFCNSICHKSRMGVAHQHLQTGCCREADWAVGRAGMGPGNGCWSQASVPVRDVSYPRELDPECGPDTTHPSAQQGYTLPPGTMEMDGETWSGWLC